MSEFSLHVRISQRTFPLTWEVEKYKKKIDGKCSIFYYILYFQVELYDCPNVYKLKQKLMDTESYMKHNKTYLFFSLFSACQ